MALVKKIQSDLPRSGGHPLGIHRVLEPKGQLPQAAGRLDVSLPIYDDEALIDVDRLNIDSASFRQLSEDAGGDASIIAESILRIVRERGKLQNPVTGSGGMLLGTVAQMGEKCDHSFQVGDRVATLVSLTLTPLALEEISSLDLHTGQARVRGHAILFSSGIAAPLPADFSEELSLAVFDVCGAPAWVKKKILPTDRVLILGMGKAGLLSALAALEVIPRDSLWVCDVRGEATRAALRCGLGAHTVLADASSPVSFQESLHRSGSGLFDLVVNTCNVPGTEAASILAAKQGGRILFFNMATDFSRAVLSAEGIGREVEMVMGNGFASGHWQYALDLVRRNRDVWKFF